MFRTAPLALIGLLTAGAAHAADCEPDAACTAPTLHAAPRTEAAPIATLGERTLAERQFRQRRAGSTLLTSGLLGATAGVGLATYGRLQRSHDVAACLAFSTDCAPRENGTALLGYGLTALSLGAVIGGAHVQVRASSGAEPAEVRLASRF
ncbi:MAG: hypothetical protein EP330_11315 [Deltaproteobacteria bacterium]|nr:MAG: hypothetical protein EP330_11315 [Deltaproteobacteria bacterium]